MDSDNSQSAKPFTRRLKAPTGAICELHNKLYFCVTDLTDDPNDPQLGKISKTKLPTAKEASAALDSAQSSKKGDKKKPLPRALFFSHLEDNPQKMFTLKKGFIFNTDIKPRADVSGVVFDTRSVDEFKKGDVYFDIDRDSGNIMAAFVMPKGWNEARSRNELCHECGAFPAHVLCVTCTSGRFCTFACYLNAKKGQSHSKSVCDQFVKGKVAAAYINQYNGNIADIHDLAQIKINE